MPRRCSSAARSSGIILSRPAVEAGERLGFLPGDMREKVDPYLRPLYDALYDMMPPDKVERGLQSGMIEVAPLAFMRGRTLANAVVILDEAQNTTSMQMKMFLTRLGENSQMIVTGDPTQIDLPPGQVSGLVEAIELLRGRRPASPRSASPPPTSSAIRWSRGSSRPMTGAERRGRQNSAVARQCQPRRRSGRRRHRCRGRTTGRPRGGAAAASPRRAIAAAVARARPRLAADCEARGGLHRRRAHPRAQPALPRQGQPDQRPLVSRRHRRSAAVSGPLLGDIVLARRRDRRRGQRAGVDVRPITLPI